MKLVFTLNLVLSTALLAAAHDYPLPPNWDKPKSRHQNAVVTGTLSAHPKDLGRADRLGGIRCNQDNESCGGCETGMMMMSSLNFTDQIGDDSVWKNGQLVACAPCQRCDDDDDANHDCLDASHKGLCVFTENMKADEEITGGQVKGLVEKLRRHGCGRCGGTISIPPGNTTKHGQVTVKFVP